MERSAMSTSCDGRRRIICKRFAVSKWSTLLATVTACMVISGCSPPPQLEGDEDCLTAAEALWTAVTSKRTPLIDASAAEIEKLHASGRLHDDAYETLTGVVASARAGEWDTARKSLKNLLSGQRPATR